MIMSIYTSLSLTTHYIYISSDYMNYYLPLIMITVIFSLRQDNPKKKTFSIIHLKVIYSKVKGHHNSMSHRVAPFLHSTNTVLRHLWETGFVESLHKYYLDSTSKMYHHTLLSFHPGMLPAPSASRHNQAFSITPL